MKVSPLSTSAAGTPGSDIGNVNVGSTANAEKLAVAKALAAGQEPERFERDPQVERAQNIRKIVMRTNVSPDRYESGIVQESNVTPDPVSTNSTKTDMDGQTNVAVESTQPLSPQFAALAKQRRALQVKERELAEREAKVAKPHEQSDDFVSKADILSNPLKIFDLGLTYDQLTEAILANQSGVTPEIKSLQEELRRVKEDVNKSFTERDKQAEKQVLAEMRKEAESLVKDGDAYEMVRETKSLPHVIDLIYRTYKKTGEVLSVNEALDLVETDLITETLKVAKLKKVQSKIATAPVQPPQSQGKQMRTLTSRDGSGVPLDRRSRAIAAMKGTLGK